MPTFDRQSRFTLTIPNAEPEYRVFDGPGEYPLPDEPEWLQVPAPSRHREPILVSNAHRYLLDNHYDVLLRLARHRRPVAWLHAQWAQAEQWGWLEQEQLQFLVVHSLQFPHFALPAAWDPQPNETPHMHFERVSQMAAFWQGEGVL